MTAANTCVRQMAYNFYKMYFVRCVSEIWEGSPGPSKQKSRIFHPRKGTENSAVPPLFMLFSACIFSYR